ncbi:60S ribosomal protein L29 [Gregarina niphandrodes]|uniref:60S ribosomal protein L29 n=1 Tax=Gregarina niphandrodes TaxID=110365 RepID=A0A023B9J0_GRENI|nr:60S ribosomal protein L29 [Gregarina niphandrodes]EZG72783.1 60S ribosomal protein L29 [Gregarina niphandrodes]|eukprot:XP_011129755.1 60S ribosomal protein L29 [Gregarina niphandrodes]
MAKSKNHTNHNQSRKAHRNGIKKLSLKKVVTPVKHLCPKYKKNLKSSRGANWNARFGDASESGSEE